MQRKRLLAIGCEMSLFKAGGQEVLVKALVKGLLEFYDIVLISGDSRPEVEGVKTHLPWSAYRDGYEGTKRLAAKLKELGVELVHFHGGTPYAWGGRVPGKHPAIACHRQGLPCILSTHLVESTFSGYCGPQKPLWFKAALFPGAWFSRLVLLNSLKAEVTDSNENRDRLRRLWFPFRERITTVYHSRIDQGNLPLLSFSTREPLILNAATVALRKGQVTLVEAFARLASKHPAWKLGFAGYVGEESYLKLLQQKIAEHDLKDRVVFYGVLDSSALDGLLKRTSIFALPSLAEGLPLSLQEALYAGCACVASRVSGIPELIDEEENGLMVAPGSVNELTQALDRLMGAAALRQRFSEQSRPSILRKGITSRQMVENYRKLYETFLR